MKRLWMVIAVVMLLLTGCAPEAKPGVRGAPAKTISEARARAIKALQKLQLTDGSFGAVQPELGIAGLLAAGIAGSPQRNLPEARAILAKAAPYIVAQARPDGSFNTENLKSLANYRTAACALALAAVDRAQHQALLTKARQFLLSIQLTESQGIGPKDWRYAGWGYKPVSKEPGAREEPKPDGSNTFMANRALDELGLARKSAARKRALIFWERLQNLPENEHRIRVVGRDGGGYYRPRGDDGSKAGTVALPDGTVIFRSYGSMTYALLQGYAFCNLDKNDDRVKAAVKWIQQNYDLDRNIGMPVAQEKQGLYYYYYAMSQALAALEIRELQVEGRKINWAEDLSDQLLRLQGPDGLWVNQAAARWYEGDPALATAYALLTLNTCERQMK